MRSSSILARLLALVAAARAVLQQREALVLENLALRQQLAVLHRATPHPRLLAVDRAFWAALSCRWSGWREALAIVKPETVVRWHRQGFRLFWRWKSRRRTGRPDVNAATRRLITEMTRANPLWGAPRIHGELLKVGVRVAQSTVARYLPVRPRRPPPQTWRAFLTNHLNQAAAMDFFVIPTATFRLLYGFVVLGHGRRRILHVAVTAHPTAEWTRQQLREAFPFDSAPRFLHRDRDSIFSDVVRGTIMALGANEVVSAPRSPWQNPYCERVIGTLRRELLDKVIVVGEAHAKRLLREYAAYYNASRTHLALAKDAPDERTVEGPERGRRVVALPVLGGLHHRYERRAA